ncbi:hypothetical protein AAG570_012818 [Ranatra chinensis]|uniref:Uncharacterized protein n=1 Tax=Ranatra chinensis TaxID=642074 RepID=A0ABD0YGW7_9HEMI
MGQILEYETRSDPTLSLFTMERYSAITKYSISQIHFQLPVLLAMILKDFLDCYGSSENSLKPSTGIEEGKCTWMSVVALQRVSDTQKKIFIDCYGKKDEKKVASVMEIYRLVGVTSTYKRFQEMNNELLLTQIQQVSRGLPHKLFLRFLNNPNRSTP